MLSFGLDCRHTDEVEEVEALRVRKERVPQSDHITHIELLAHQEHEPSQRVKLVIDTLLLQVLVDTGVKLF